MKRKNEIIAEGVIFNNKKCVIHWLGEKQSIVIWDNFEDAKNIHEHNGETKFFFMDFGDY